MCKLKKVANGQKEDAHDDGAGSEQGEPEPADGELAAPAAAAAAAEGAADAVPAARRSNAAPGKKGKLGKRPAPDSTGVLAGVAQVLAVGLHGCTAALIGFYTGMELHVMGMLGCAGEDGEDGAAAAQPAPKKRKESRLLRAAKRELAEEAAARDRSAAASAVAQPPQQDQAAAGKKSKSKGRAKGAEMNGLSSRQPQQQGEAAKKGATSKGGDVAGRSQQTVAEAGRTGVSHLGVGMPAAPAVNGGGGQAVQDGKKKPMKKLLGTAGAAVSAGGVRRKQLHGMKAGKRKTQA